MNSAIVWYLFILISWSFYPIYHMNKQKHYPIVHSYRVQGLVAVALAVERGCGRRWQQHHVSHDLHKKGQGSFVWSTGLLLLLSLCFNTPLKTQLYTLYTLCVLSLSHYSLSLLYILYWLVWPPKCHYS